MVTGVLLGRLGERLLNLALDTGSSETVLIPSVLDDVGYSLRDGEASTVIRSVVGQEPGYLARVARLSALGHSFPNFRVHVHDLPEGYGIDGLLGLSYLRHFNYEIRSAEGRILTARIGE